MKRAKPLTARELEIIEHARWSVKVAWNLSLTPSPYARRFFERMKNPRIGDTVVELSTMLSDAHQRIRFGKLIRIEHRKRQGKVWILRGLGGRILRWHNADFVAVPSRAMWKELSENC